MRPEIMVREFVAQFIPVGHGVHIQARTADQERNRAAGKDPVDRRIGKALEVGHGKKLPRLAYVQQMMGYALHLLRRHLA